MDPTLKQMLIPVLVAAFSIVFGAGVTYVITSRGKMVQRVSDLEKQLAVVGAQIAPISAVYQSALIKTLTHFHTPIIDALMEKVDNKGVVALTDKEESELLIALEKVAKDPETDEYETAAANALPYVMTMARIDAQQIADADEPPKFIDIQVVGRPKVTVKEG